MANILILAKNLPYPLDSGNTLRIFYPCQEMAKYHDGFLVTFGEQNLHVAALRDLKVFKDITVLPTPKRRTGLKRHFRRTNLNLVKLSSPDFYQSTVDFLQEQIRRHKIEVAVSWPAILTEFLEPLRNVHKIADSCDCITLTQEREFRNRKHQLSATQRAIAWLDLYRSRQFEKILPQVHDYVVSISPADRQRLIALNEAARHKIVLIPNGIPRQLLSHSLDAPEIENAIVFWGNLHFAPNHSAIIYFYEKVYAPFLSNKSIKWYIVGRNPNERIRDIAQREENIILTGFIDNLYDLVAQIPIVINPMVIGSGMKNKVLEAFALRRTVVSNKLGIEAVVGAQAGVHYVSAEHPEEFAGAIVKYLHEPESRQAFGASAHDLVEQKYTWDLVGDQWNQLIEKTLRGGTTRELIAAKRADVK